MNNLVVILGAGFSFPAGLPLANDIKERFNRIQKEKLLLDSSSEWMWEDNKDKTTIHNGKIGFDHLAYSYILDEIINTYNREVSDFDNYEVFFSYVLHKFDNLDWFKEVYKRAKETIVSDKPFLIKEPIPHSDYLLIFDKDPHISKLQDIFNYLIADMLFVSNATIDDSINCYENFINYIQRFDRVDIFTLNHDLLLEKILSKKSISFCRGFSFENSDVFYEDNPLPIFNNYFEDKINIHKLHGSTDFFKFQHFENDGGLFWKPTDILQKLKSIKVPNIYKYPPKGDDGAPMLLEKSKFVTAKKVKSQLTFYEDSNGEIRYGKNPDIEDRYLLIRPDVTFFDANDKAILLIELVITHKVKEEKKIKLRRLGIDTVSIIVPKSSEQEIDNLVYKLYNLTYEEACIVESELPARLTKAAYEAIEI